RSVKSSTLAGGIILAKSLTGILAAGTSKALAAVDISPESSATQKTIIRPSNPRESVGLSPLAENFRPSFILGTGRTIWIKVSNALPQRSRNQTRNRFFTTKITKNTKFESIKKNESFVAFVRFVVRSYFLSIRRLSMSLQKNLRKPRKLSRILVQRARIF